MSRPTPHTPYVPAAYREGTPLAQKIARENAEVRKSMARDAARRSARYGPPQSNRGGAEPSTPESADAEEVKGKGKNQAGEKNVPCRRRRPGQAPLLGPWIRVYGIVCPRCHAVRGELCHTSSGEFRPVWEPHRGREKPHLRKRTVTDRGVRPQFEQALTAWESGMSAKQAGVVNQLPGDDRERQQEKGAGTRQPQVAGGRTAMGKAKPTGRVQSRSTSGVRGRGRGQGLPGELGQCVLDGIQGVGHGLRGGEAAMIGPDVTCTHRPRSPLSTDDTETSANVMETTGKPCSPAATIGTSNAGLAR